MYVSCMKLKTKQKTRIQQFVMGRERGERKRQRARGMAEQRGVANRPIMPFMLAYTKRKRERECDRMKWLNVERNIEVKHQYHCVKDLLTAHQSV